MRILILLVLFLTGCATEWMHPTASNEQFYQDRRECSNYSQGIERTIVAARSAPPVYDTNCTRMGNNVNCRTTQNNSGDAFARANQSMEQGGADFARAFAVSARFDDCMNSKGYTARSLSDKLKDMGK